MNSSIASSNENDSADLLTNDIKQISEEIIEKVISSTDGTK